MVTLNTSDVLHFQIDVRLKNAFETANAHLIGCRSSKTVQVRACARVQIGTCRKVICERCLTEFPDLAQPCDDEKWICSHCRGLCPERGQCYVSIIQLYLQPLFVPTS
jgi:ubiquitin C-terminal hydrolase